MDEKSCTCTRAEAWVTMITPFNTEHKIDYAITERLIEWYLDRGVDGIFAVCQSSEMELLTREERRRLGKFVVDTVAGRVPVVVSGHVSESEEDQLRDFEAARESGCCGVVLVSNRFCHDGEESFLKHLEKFLSRIDEKVPLGIYECPHPFKKLLTVDEMKYCADTGRFSFFKDTCCDANMIRQRIQTIKHSPLRLFNANSDTLLQSLQDGAAGYNGVMANIHPELYRWLCENFRTYPEFAQELSDFISVSSAVECRTYPACAKYYLSHLLDGFQIYSRRGDVSDLPSAVKLEMDALGRQSKRYWEKCCSIQ